MMTNILGQAAELENLLAEMDEGPRLKSVPVIKRILRRAPSSGPRSRRTAGPNMSQPRNRQLPYNRALLGNPDLAVLKAENQNVTHVTPRIAELIQGLVKEEICVIGARPPPPDMARLEILKQKAYKELCSLIQKARITRRNIDWKKEDRITRQSDYVHSVTIDGQRYSVSGRL